MTGGREIPVSDKSRRATAQPGDAAGGQSEQLERTARKADTSAAPVERFRSWRTIVSYSSYGEAERAVDWPLDQGFAVGLGLVE